MTTQELLRRYALPLILGGGALFGILILSIGALAVIARSSAPAVAQPQEQGYAQSQGYSQGQGFSQGYNQEETQMPQGGGYAPAPSGYVASGASAPDAGNDAINNGYWERQRSQDQQAQAFDGYVNDTNALRDTQTGEVHSDVSNSVADPAIQSGAATEVPTSELPTSEPAPSADAGATATTE